MTINVAAHARIARDELLLTVEQDHGAEQCTDPSADINWRRHPFGWCAGYSIGRRAPAPKIVHHKHSEVFGPGVGIIPEPIPVAVLLIMLFQLFNQRRRTRNFFLFNVAPETALKAEAEECIERTGQNGTGGQ